MRFYTCGNDRMIDFLRITLAAARRALPNAEFRIIPFDDNLELTRGLAARVGATIVEPDPYWDELGMFLFKDTDYRPGVPAYRYFRKFNAFNGDPDSFVFCDANMAILADLSPLFEAFEKGSSSIVFSRYAVPRQFKPHVLPKIQLLNPHMRDGYSCSGFIARGNALPRRDVDVFFRNPLWGKWLGQAPEQGFISLYSAIYGIAWETYGELLGYGPEDTVGASRKRERGADGFYYFSKGDLAGKLSYFCKWTHQSLKPDAPNIEIHDELAARARRFYNGLNKAQA